MVSKVRLFMFLGVLTIVAMLSAMTAVYADSYGYDGKDEPKKVTICHYPPGNPKNAQIITVGESSVDDHKKNHGDNFPKKNYYGKLYCKGPSYY